MTAIRQATISSPLGPLLALADVRDRLCGLHLPGSVHAPHPSRLPARVDHGGVLAAAREQLDAHFAGELTEFDLPLTAAGSPFQQRVWRALRAVPHGTTTTYGELAAALGIPGSARAVGSANARNPICLVGAR